MANAAPKPGSNLRSGPVGTYRHILNTVNLVLLLSTVAFMVWHNRGLESIREQMEQYHLKTISSASATKERLHLVALALLAQASETATSTPGDSILATHSDIRVALYEAEFELSRIVETQNNYGGLEFKELTSNCERHFFDFKALLSSSLVGDAKVATSKRQLAALNLNLEQLRRLHRSEYAVLTKALSKQSRQRLLILIALVAGLMVISYGSTRSIMKSAEQTALSIQENEQAYREIVEDHTELICRALPDTTITFVNHAYCRCTGQSREDLIGHKITHFIQEEEWAEIQKSFDCLGPENPVSIHEYRVTLPDGEEHWFRWTNRAILDETGKMVEFQGTGYDFTEQKQADEAREVAEQRLRSVLAAMPDPVLVLDKLGRYLEVLSGRKDMLYRGARLSDVLPPDTSGKCLAAIGETLVTGESQNILFRLEIPTGDCWFEARTFPLQLPGEDAEAVIWVSRDISAKHQAEEQVRKLSRAVEQSPSLVVITDLEGGIEFVNERFCEVTGYEAEEVIGHNPRLLRGGETSRGVYENLWALISAGKTWRGEFHNRKKNGELYWESATIGPIKDALGETTHYLAIKEDISEGKRLAEERQALQAQLAQAQRLETLGTLAGGIAHDFNNILAPIMGYSEMALGKVDKQSRVHAYLGYILASANRASDLVDQILTFSRAGERPHPPVAIHLIAVEAANMLRGWIPANVEIRTDIARDSGTVNSDPTQLNQVLMNLCTNAVHAMGDEGGVLNICLERLLDCTPLTRQGALARGDWIHLAVSDTGTGMNAATRERIFEPFFTTKAVDEGTGLGLSVVHGILKSYGAAVSVESKLGKGSTFHIYFPPGEISALKPIVQNGIANRSDARILFVDDEEPIALMMKEVLVDHGYRLTIQTRAQRALAILSERGADYDMVISDQNMPDMTGCELAEKVKELLPQMPFILFSGYNEVVDEGEITRLGIRQYLKKPMAMGDMCRAIERTLVQQKKG